MNQKRLKTLRTRAQRGASSGDLVQVSAGELLTMVETTQLAVEIRDHIRTYYPLGLASFDGPARDFAQRLFWAVREAT